MLLLHPLSAEIFASKWNGCRFDFHSNVFLLHKNGARRWVSPSSLVSIQQWYAMVDYIV